MDELTVEEFVVDTYLTDPRGLMAWFHNQSVNDAADALDDLVRHRVRSAVEAQKEKDAKENARLREVLGGIGKQQLVGEMNWHNYTQADFEGGYEECVKSARAGIKEPSSGGEDNG